MFQKEKEKENFNFFNSSTHTFQKKSIKKDGYECDEDLNNLYDYYSNNFFIFFICFYLSIFLIAKPIDSINTNQIIKNEQNQLINKETKIKKNVLILNNNSLKKELIKLESLNFQLNELAITKPNDFGILYALKNNNKQILEIKKLIEINDHKLKELN